MTMTARRGFAAGPAMAGVLSRERSLVRMTGRLQGAVGGVHSSGGRPEQPCRLA